VKAAEPSASVHFDMSLTEVSPESWTQLLVKTTEFRFNFRFWVVFWMIFAFFAHTFWIYCVLICGKCDF
jgi:hypothetical protein